MRPPQILSQAPVVDSFIETGICVCATEYECNQLALEQNPWPYHGNWRVSVVISQIPVRPGCFIRILWENLQPQRHFCSFSRTKTCFMCQLLFSQIVSWEMVYSWPFHFFHVFTVTRIEEQIRDLRVKLFLCSLLWSFFTNRFDRTGRFENPWPWHRDINIIQPLSGE